MSNNSYISVNNMDNYNLFSSIYQFSFVNSLQVLFFHLIWNQIVHIISLDRCKSTWIARRWMLWCSAYFITFKWPDMLLSGLFEWCVICTSMGFFFCEYSVLIFHNFKDWNELKWMQGAFLIYLIQLRTTDLYPPLCLITFLD